MFRAAPRFLLCLLGIAFIAGCTTSLSDSEPLVCTPGDLQCDESNSRILECHSTGAAWELKAYCSSSEFCQKATCVDITGGFEEGFATSTDGDANVPDGSSTTTDTTESDADPSTGEESSDSLSEENDAESAEEGGGETVEAPRIAATDAGEDEPDATSSRAGFNAFDCSTTQECPTRGTTCVNLADTDAGEEESKYCMFPCTPEDTDTTCNDWLGVFVDSETTPVCTEPYAGSPVTVCMLECSSNEDCWGGTNHVCSEGLCFPTDENTLL